ncbi:hydroxymyristoyl-ACP dehydratase [Piscinibacter koreensis]|uniref:Hydroxymyristoyl-ACP dehydratase n=1 Tax=Piscinibacter koreensis TaxID=2742824 RepID=A0A7Y6NLL5_9BURK|nr:hydroxymyristoyl-ACP dehydratase [Schlegelella koreensis]NUZ05458.1 hydroxymyristoyl-ACP dehydratase [Schlegelella koreensis]
MNEHLDHAAIERLIPHRGPMCLLDRLESWDATRIVCVATNHRDPRHPLRTRSGLLASATIEYAAQAMALHGALLGRAAGVEPSAGYLASARGVVLARWRLDDLPAGTDAAEGAADAFPPDALRIEATRQAGDARQILYAFDVTHRGSAVASGRAAVVLNTSIEPR